MADLQTMFDFHADLGFHQAFGHSRVAWVQLSATFQGPGSQAEHFPSASLSDLLILRKLQWLMVCSQSHGV